LVSWSAYPDAPYAGVAGRAWEAKRPCTAIPIGTLTLVVLELPTARRAWIEDVVVDQSARGRGVGEAMTRHALHLASVRGATTIDLTTNPARDAANRLYRRLGFRLRETNPYRFEPGVDALDA